jgi:hypothetical protein
MAGTSPKSNTTPVLTTVRLNGFTIGIASGQPCPRCGLEYRPADIEETADGWRLICSSDRGCHQASLTCERN